MRILMDKILDCKNRISFFFQPLFSIRFINSFQKIIKTCMLFCQVAFEFINLLRDIHRLYEVFFFFFVLFTFNIMAFSFLPANSLFCLRKDKTLYEYVKYIHFVGFQTPHCCKVCKIWSLSSMDVAAGVFLKGVEHKIHWPFVFNTIFYQMSSDTYPFLPLPLGWGFGPSRNFRTSALSG